MLKQPKPKVFTPEQQEAIAQASSMQTGKVTVPLSYDPEHFPVFEIPVNGKVLVYIPNHTILDASANTNIRMDKCALHPIFDGRSHTYLRCTQGVEAPEFGLDGSCPACDASRTTRDLTSTLYSKEAERIGADTKTEGGKEVMKPFFKEIVKQEAIVAGEVWYTFPIVLIDCEENTTKVKLTEGKVTGTPCFYSLREVTYIKKFVKPLEAKADEDGDCPSSPAGLWAVLDFTYEIDKSKNPNGTHDKMGSAKELAVTYRTVPESYQAYASSFDILTEEWTPAKIMEIVVRNAFRDMEETVEIVDSVMVKTLDKLAMLEIGKKKDEEPVKGLGDGTQGSALENYGAKEVVVTQPESGVAEDGGEIPIE